MTLPAPETPPATPPAAPPVPPTPPPAAGGTPPATPPADPPAEPSWLKERLEREAKTAREKMLKELGYTDADAAKKAAEEHATLKKQADDARKAQLSETEREKERATKAEADLVTERAKFAALEQQSQLNSACAQLGVKNTGYAQFLFTQARAADPTADAAAVLTKALADEGNRSALGAGVVPTVTVPTGDTAPPAPTPPGSPPPGGTGPQAFDAAKASTQDWAAYKASIGARF